MTVAKVRRAAIRCPMTRIRPTAAARMISAVMARVTQAAAGMTVLLSGGSDSAREVPARTGVPDGADRSVAARAVRDGQHLRDVVEFPGQLDAAVENVISRPA